ncbi:glycine, alanine and asparagine-rich protein [Drosophila ficusphila]|uniref:glycine, alanine and asparagine-rich protein n=1 Tax=Drosophila ficusphila TaxID=30025 RepID=UPI0007E624B5|nr:glycine, alanine and asparagine-rich protein [Drosophila ficusphila]
MRMRGYLAMYLLLLRLLFHCTSSHILVKRQLHKRMVNPRMLLNDFAAIKGTEVGVAAVKKSVRSVDQADVRYDVGGAGSGAGSGAGNGAGGAGTGGGTGEPGSKNSSQKECQGQGEPNAKCNAKAVITPGDPKQKSSAIAMKAAQDAKAASEAQAAAGQAAAHHIKLELAEKAFQSAKAAEAALMGKQMMVDQLEQEVQEASAVVEEETNAIHHTEANMNAAVEAAKAATQQFETINELQKNSREALANIQAVALGSQQELAAKTQLLEAARNRMATLQKQLVAAHDDYEKTKTAAYKAACAAVEAKQRAGNALVSYYIY